MNTKSEQEHNRLVRLRRNVHRNHQLARSVRKVLKRPRHLDPPSVTASREPPASQPVKVPVSSTPPTPTASTSSLSSSLAGRSAPAATESSSDTSDPITRPEGQKPEGSE